ncbi:MAG: hypothetical protein MJY62_04985 [Bacteroidales bacterium]|nr:hypothetical protein [Bacteroidales bacterium]
MKAGKVIALSLRCIATAAIAGALVTVVVLGNSYRGKQLCSSIEICIPDSSSLHFIGRKEVERMICEKWGDRFVGKYVTGIELGEVESALMKRSVIRKADAYFTCDGVLHIDVYQRNPVARFCPEGERPFYMDCEGRTFHISGNNGPEVITFTGNICRRAQWKDDVLELCLWMRDKGWAQRIKSIRCDSDGNLTMYLADGWERVIFGGPRGYQRKFASIDKYRDKIRPVKPDRYYKSVNVKFDGQIICRK